MRLSLYEIENILKIKDKYFGTNSKIFLFGSRLDDDKKGGDIDLYLLLDKVIDDKYILKEQFLLELKEKIGEQKIDLILSLDDSRSIEIQACKGVELDIDKIKLEKYFNECDKHLQRINEAFEDIKDIIPLSVKKYKSLNKDEVQAIDQYLYRFSKLQDTLGQKIFKVILNIYEPDQEALPFLDVLNKLEKLDFLEDKKEWLNLREKRNKIAHQYDDEPYEMTEAINDILYQKKILESVYLGVKNRLIEGLNK